MTKNSNRKEKIRARMDETGEVYSVARQALDRQDSCKQVEPLRPKRKPIVTRPDLIVFCERLAALLKTGMSITDALEISALHTTKQTLREAIAATHVEVLKGSTLAVAMELHPEAFKGILPALVRKGQEGGFLAHALESASQVYKTELSYSGAI